MQITLDIPEEIAHSLASDAEQLHRFALEAVALEGVRSGNLSTGQARRLLGFTTRIETDGFLKSHGVLWDMTPEEIESDIATAAEFSQKNLASRSASE